jgi:hypothetical protein
MTMDELKYSWQQYNEQLAASKKLNEQVLLSMIRERSTSRVSKIRRESFMLLLVLGLEMVLLVAIIIGNPFDFKYQLQFIPYVLLGVAVLMAIYSLIRTIQNFDVTITNDGLTAFLQKTINAYEKNRKAEKWFGAIIFSAGVLTAFSFLPKKLEPKEFWPAISETGVSILITLLIYVIAFKLGAFKNRKKEGFENDWKELAELKAISCELENE